MRWLLATLLLSPVLGGCARRSEEAPGAPSAKPVAAASGLAAPSAAASPSGAPSAQPGWVRVALDGTVSGTIRELDGSPRLYARAFTVPIHERPDPASRKLGSLRVGASAPLRGGSAGNAGCSGGWAPIAPEGFVCEGPDTSRDPNEPAVRLARPYAPELGRRLPYIYGTVRRPGPVYQRLPSDEELGKEEPDYESKLRSWLGTEGEEGAGFAQHVWTGTEKLDRSPSEAFEARYSDSVPWFLEGGKSVPNVLRDKDFDGKALVRTRMKPKVGHSFLTTVFHRGRRYGVGTDGLLYPTDRLRPIQGSAKHGVRIGVDIDFPFALVRRQNAYFIELRGGKPTKGEAAEWFTPVKLTGKQRFFNVTIDGKSARSLHYEVEGGRYISDQFASLVRPAKRMPKWGKNGERWLDVALARQLLILYQGEKPVYATLVSSGEAGLEDPEHTTATKRGIFRIHTKLVTATMDSDEVGEEFELRDVPYVQYFDKAGYALHGAYWHDRFGTPKSHGCINLTPEDARRVFSFTEPAVPPGWHSRLAPLTGSVLFIHP